MSQDQSARFANPLLYVDPIATDDEAGFRLALAYAKANGTPLTVVSAVDKPATSFLGYSDRSKRALLEVVARAEHKLAKLAETATSEGVKPAVELLRGVPYLELVKKADEGKHDIVVKTMMGTHENAGTPYGAIARKLLRKCPGAVLLVHPDFDTIERTILSLAPDENAADVKSMAARVARAGRAWADFAGAPIHVLHAWTAYGESFMAQRLSMDELTKYIEAEKKAARSQIKNTLRALQLDLPDDRVHLIEGSPEKVIPAFASNPRTDVIVLGSVARGGVKGLLLGNTAEEILQNVGCSILVVKPGDFISPFA